MAEKATYRYEITGIDCADCAAKLEEKIRKIEGIENVSLSFMNNKLVYDCDHDEGSRIAEEVQALVKKEEPDAVLTSKGHKHHHHEECECRHDHEEHAHEETEEHDHETCECHEHAHEEHDHDACSCHDHHEHKETATYRYEITGIDCADCAAKLEEKIRKIEGISNVSLFFMNNSLVYDCDHDEGSRIAEEVQVLVKKEEPDAVLTSKGHKHHHHHEECECRHDHEEHDHDACSCHDHHEHEETATYRYEITGIDCADCAAKLEEKIRKIEGISNVSLSFMNSSLVYDCDHDEGSRIAEEVQAIVKKEEPDAVLTSKGHKHHHHHEEHHEECECHEHAHEEHDHDACSCHDHHDHEETATYRYEITGIDCADCAAKLEEKIRKIEGISNVSLSFMNNSLVYDCDHDEGSRIAEEVRALVEKEEPDAVLTSKGHKHHEHHDEHAEPEKPRTITADTHKYRITGLDCADCAAKLEGKLAGIEGISNVSISFVNSLLYFDCAEADEERILNDIRTVSAREEPEAVIEAITKKVPAPVQKEDRTMLYRLIAGALLFAAGMFMSGSLQTALMIFAYIVLGWDVIYKAVKGIGRGQVFDEHFLMAVATLAAIYLHDFKEAAGVMLFYQIGEYFQEMAVRRSRRSISELMDIRPDHAEVFRDGDWITADPEDIEIGEIIRVKPGERISLDGVVVKGSSSLDTSSLTGESKMTDVDPDDEVLSGSVNKTGILEIRVQKEYGDSTVARILDLVENQDTKKSREEQFITKFSRIYTPAVVFSAILTAIVVTMLGYGLKEGIERACTFLVISCPCALVISIPLSFFAGIGGLSSRGVLVKGAYMIEPVAKLKNIVMDKTGTLTSGEFTVAHISGEDRDTVLKHAAYAEHFSNHPLAQGILDAYGKEIDESLLSEQTEIPGRGISVKTEGKLILAGNSRLMEDNGIELQKADETGTVIYVAYDGRFEGYIVLADKLKDGALNTIRQLQKDCVRCFIVSGDKQAVVDEAAAELHTDGAFGECMPEDKVNRIRELQKTGTVGFVGDGVNDAPVIMAADAGFAMGALGSDAAIEAADVVLMDDQPEKVSLAINAAKRILRVARQNIIGAITVKIITLILSAFGIANMWMAIFADTGVAMLCVLNSMRLLHIARK